MEVGQYLDFHVENTGAARDYDGRIQGQNGGGTLLIPKKNGTIATTDDIHQCTVVDGTNALTWGTNVTLATVDGVTIDAKLPNNPNTDTHYIYGFTVKANTIQAIAYTQNAAKTLTLSDGNLISLSATKDDGKITFNHSTVGRTNSTSTSAPATTGTFTTVDSVTTDNYGHVTGVNTKTVTMPRDDTKYDSANVGLTTIAAYRGGSRSTNNAGYWAGMLNSSQTGSPTLPGTGWWHVLSMDWAGTDTAN